MATSIQAQILEKLDKQGEVIGQIQTQTALTNQTIGTMLPRLTRLHEVVIEGCPPNTKPLLQRMELVEGVITKKKENSDKTKWLIIGAVIVNTVGMVFAYFK